jgi:hypothetical protein
MGKRKAGKRKMKREQTGESGRREIRRERGGIAGLA